MHKNDLLEMIFACRADARALWLRSADSVLAAVTQAIYCVAPSTVLCHLLCCVIEPNSHTGISLRLDSQAWDLFGQNQVVSSCGSKA